MSLDSAPGAAPVPGWAPPAAASASASASASALPAAVEGESRRFVRPVSLVVGVALVGLSVLLWLVTREGVQLLIGVAVLTAAVTDVVVARRALAGLRVHLMADGETIAGEESHWMVRVDGLRRPASVVPAIFPRPPGVLVTTASGGRVALPPLSRGVVYSLVFDLTVQGPIGLFEAGRRVRVRPDQPVFVGPRPSELDLVWPQPKAIGFASSEVAPIGDDLYRSTRPYVRGDSVRRVHWKATARHGELMVREQDGVGVALAQIVVDLGAPGPHAEHVASVAGQIARDALARGWAVHLVTSDAVPQPPPDTPLGSPFGLPPARSVAPASAVRSRSQRVRSFGAITEQLATATAGVAPVAPRFHGLVCRVTPAGVVWT